MTFLSKKLSECCIIKHAKSEVTKVLSKDDLVSFVPMRKLGINTKSLLLDEMKPLSEVVNGYTCFSDGDVLMAKITPCFENGKLGIAKGLKNGVGFGSSEFVVFRVKDCLTPEYLYYYLIQPSFRDRGQKVMTGAAGHKRVPKFYIENEKVPVPSVNEQKHIVKILDKAFSNIEKIRANTEKNLKNTRELFESYLQQVFSQHDCVWIENRLSDISCLNYGYTEKAQFEKVGPRFLRITDIKKNKVNWELVPFCTVHNDDLEKHKLDDGDIVFARTGATTGKSYLVKSPPRSVFASYLIRLRLDLKKVLPDFVYFYFQTRDYWDKVSVGISGSAQGGFNASKLGNMLVSYPKDIKNQRVLVDKFYKIEKHIVILEDKLTEKLVKLDHLKKSILQKAFTGQLTQKQTVPA